MKILNSYYNLEMINLQGYIPTFEELYFFSSWRAELVKDSLLSKDNECSAKDPNEPSCRDTSDSFLWGFLS